MQKPQHEPGRDAPPRPPDRPPPGAAPGLVTVETTDPSEYELALTPWDLLCRPSQAGDFSHRLKLFAGEAFMLYREDYRLGVNLSGLSPPGLLLVSLPAAHAEEAVYWGHDHEQTCIPCAAPGEASAFLPSGYTQWVAGIDIEAFRKAASPAACARLESRMRSHALPCLPGTRRRLRRWVGDILVRLEHEPALAHSKPFSDRCFDELVRHLVELADHEPARRSTHVTSQAQRGFHRALEYLREAPMKDVRLSRLCEVSGVCERSLQYAFHDAVGMSPKAFMRVRRLHAARRVLVGADPSQTRICDVATRFGFFELGRFAGHYRQHFGECPSDTLRRTR